MRSLAPQAGIEPMSLSCKGGFLTTEPAGSPCLSVFTLMRTHPTRIWVGPSDLFLVRDTARVTGHSCNSVMKDCDFCVRPAGTHMLHFVFLAAHFAEESNLVARPLRAKNQRWSLTNIQRGAEVLSPITCKELNCVNRHRNKHGTRSQALK